MVANPINGSLTSASALREELERHRIVDTDRLAAAMAVFPSGGALRLAEFLVSRGVLTAFQAERVLAGQARSLTVGEYRILEPHHVGTFGPVFRAINGNREFALRVLPLRSLWQAKQARELVRALSEHSDLPGCAPLTEADSSRESHYLAWPLVTGELLADRVHERGPYSITGVIELLTKLADALAACHDRGILHGLLTPQSVCIDSEGSPLLLEVGAGMLLASNLAEDDSLFDTMSSALAVAGAFDYAAPEWVANPASLKPAMDQYALGAVCVFALTGSTPTLDSRILQSRNVPPRLVQLLQRMVEADPAERFPSMQDVRSSIATLNSKSAHRLEAIPAQSGRKGEIDESVRFDAIDAPPGEPADAARQAAEPRNTPRIERRHVNRPVLLPLAEPIEEVNKPARSKKSKLPELPAAPLAPDTAPSRGSRCWNVATTSPVSRPPQPSPVSVWTRIKRGIRFWRSKGDTIQVSVFGPAEVALSQSPQLTVFLHTPSVAESAATLARAFHHDAVLLGTGTVQTLVQQDVPIDIHLALSTLSVTNPLCGFQWQGQPHRLTFNFVVPWGTRLGPAKGLISIGRNQMRIGKVEFQIVVRD